MGGQVDDAGLGLLGVDAGGRVDARLDGFHLDVQQDHVKVAGKRQFHRLRAGSRLALHGKVRLAVQLLAQVLAQDVVILRHQDADAHGLLCLLLPRSGSSLGSRM